MLLFDWILSGLKHQDLRSLAEIRKRDGHTANNKVRHYSAELESPSINYTFRQRKLSTAEPGRQKVISGNRPSPRRGPHPALFCLPL